MSGLTVVVAVWAIAAILLVGAVVFRSAWARAAAPRVGMALLPLAAVPLLSVASAAIQSSGAVERRAIDISSGRRNQLSPETRRFLRALPTTGGAITIVAFVPEQRAPWEDEVRLVRRLEAATPRLKVRFVDPDRRPSEALRYGATGVGDIVVEGDGRSVRADSPSERDVTTAILRVAKEDRRLCWSTGHGERPLDDPALSAARGSLGHNGFELAPVRIGRPGTDLGSCAAVVVAGPRAAPLPEEQVVWETMLAARGRALLLLDPDETPDGVANAWAGPLGVSVLPGGAVVDPEGALAGDPRALVSDRFPSANPITADVAGLLFLGTRAFAAPGDGAAPGVTASVLVTASPAASAAGVPSPPLAVAVDRSRVQKGPGGEEQIVRSRMAAFGDLDWIQNQALSALGNESVLVRTANWLAELDTLLAIRSTPPADRLALATPRDMDRLSLYTMVVPLLLLGAAGAVRWRLAARARARG